VKKNVHLNLKVFIYEEVTKKKGRNILNKPVKGVKNKTAKEEIFKIPAMITDLSQMKKNWVKVQICGLPRHDILLGMEYSINISNLAVPKNEEAWNTLADFYPSLR